MYRNVHIWVHDFKSEKGVNAQYDSSNHLYILATFDTWFRYALVSYVHTNVQRSGYWEIICALVVTFLQQTNILL